jgi:hypothetical protein
MTNDRTKMMSGAVVLATVLAAGGCGQAGDEESPSGEVIASSTAGIPRPAGVPDDYVVTPHGWRHRSCVITVGGDETVGPHHVERADGRHRAFSPCEHPAYDRSGAPLGPRAGAPLGPPTHDPQVNGWVASVNSTSQGPITALGADWIVPPTPSSAQNQTLFFFPGVEPAATGDVILQPVLAWNGFGDHAWTIASWACCKDGNVFNSSPVGVAAGHKLTGTLAGANCSGGVCANWTITTKDDNTAQSTTFATTADGEQMSWVFGGAMEIYGVDTCTEYPGSTNMKFTNIQVRNSAGGLVLPAWTAWSAASTVTPNCNPQFGSLQVSGPNGTISSWKLTWQFL